MSFKVEGLILYKFKDKLIPNHVIYSSYLSIEQNLNKTLTWCSGVIFKIPDRNFRTQFHI